jgi:hypothetical protein
LAPAGTILAVGAPNANRVQAYELVAGTWTKRGQLLKGLGNERFGYSVALNEAGNALARAEVNSPERGDDARRGEGADIPAAGARRRRPRAYLRVPRRAPGRQGPLLRVVAVLRGTGGPDVFSKELFHGRGEFSSRRASRKRRRIRPERPRDVKFRTHRSGAVWYQQDQDFNFCVANDAAGRSVSLDDTGKDLAIGMPTYREQTNAQVGRARVYALDRT